MRRNAGVVVSARILAAAFAVCLFTTFAFALDFPPLTGRVVDQAGVMTGAIVDQEQFVVGAWG